MRILSVSHTADMRQHGQLRSHVPQDPEPHSVNVMSDQYAIRQNIEHAVLNDLDPFRAYEQSFSDRIGQARIMDFGGAGQAVGVRPRVLQR